MDNQFISNSIYYLLFTVYCLLFTVYCLLFTIYSTDDGEVDCSVLYC